MQEVKVNVRRIKKSEFVREQKFELIKIYFMHLLKLKAEIKSFIFLILQTLTNTTDNAISKLHDPASPDIVFAANTELKFVVM